MVVPIEARIYVCSDANIVATGIGIAADDVHEPVSSASHAIAIRIARASLKS